MQIATTRMDLYGRLIAERERLMADADRIGRDLAIPAELKGLIGTSGAASALPGTTREDVVEAMSAAAREIVSPRALGDEIRRVVKSVYGDDYDAATANTCEAAIGVAFDALLTPPQMGRGETYRVRCIGLLERHAEHHLSYGRPFPPMYKEVFADRGAIAGELGINGRRAVNTDVVMVPMAGARYEPHGPKMMPCPLLLGTDAEATVAAVTRAARVHAADLGGFVTLGYDTPGYGHAQRDASGAPRIHAAIGRLAAEHGVPYVVDNAWGTPFIGADPRRMGADLMLYSMDKVAGAPTSGLIIGRETSMVNVRRALGIHSERYGTPSAHGKAAHVSADPGKLVLAGLLQALRVLRDEPQRVTGPIDETHRIVLEEFESVRGRLAPGILIHKSYNLGGVEINYERTWSSGPGLPIFSNEDRIAGAHLLGQAMARMGVVLSQSEDANVIVTPGFGTVDRSGALLEDRMRLVVRAVFAAMELLQDQAVQPSKAAA
jgi:hypothetical protein